MYCFSVLVFTLVMIYIVAPRYGRQNPIVYISICSLVGSVSVMAIKGFGVAVKLTFGGHNQFTHPSTYVFGIFVVLCILVQMNYFNKALDTFSTNVYVRPFFRIPSHLPAPLQSEPNVLRRLLNINHHRLPYPFPRIQYHQRNQHRLPPLRLHCHLLWSAPSQHLTDSRTTTRPQQALGPRRRADEPAHEPPGPDVA